VPACLSQAKWHDKQSRTIATEELLQLLRDPQERVRRAAISGLVLLEASGAIGSINAAKASFSVQFHPWIDRQVQKLSAAATPALANDALIARIEALELLVNELRTKKVDVEPQA
jgi:HEAT repeat protein